MNFEHLYWGVSFQYLAYQGLTNRPIKVIVLVGLCFIKNKKGWSALKTFGGGGGSDLKPPNPDTTISIRVISQYLNCS